MTDRSVTDAPGHEFDPTTDEARRDPHALYRDLRARCPVAHSDAWGGFWTLTRRADIEAAVTDPEVFSSRFGIIVPRNPASGRRPPMHYDPPEHTTYRRAINPIFRKDRLGWLEPYIRKLAVAAIDRAVAVGSADGFHDVAVPVCGHTLLELLGIPDDRRDEALAHTTAFEEAQFDFDGARVERENLALYQLCRDVVADRRRRPRPPELDLVSGLFEVEVDGTPLDDETVAGSLRQILVAGHGAPALMLASAIGHLAGDPPLQSQLRRQPALVPAAVEELLRLYTPNQGFARTVQRDVVLGGRTIPAGDVVTVPYTSANRDEAVYDRPDEFILGRPEHHLAFGYGVHLCPGAHVGRVQLRVTLTELLARTERIAPAGAVTFAPFPVYGPRTLPLALAPAGRA